MSGGGKAMNEGYRRLQDYLDSAGVFYHTIHHRSDYRARTAAVDTQTPLKEFAKTVFLWIDGAPAMAVLPASKDLAPSRLCKTLGAAEVTLAHEAETLELCPDCEIGAAPPFGNLYDLPVYVSTSLAEDEEITFNGGTHDHAVRMAFADFERLVKPTIVALAKHD
jgi:Ala-tRNA(Pro) deacylase